MIVAANAKSKGRFQFSDEFGDMRIDGFLRPFSSKIHWYCADAPHRLARVGKSKESANTSVATDRSDQQEEYHRPVVARPVHRRAAAKDPFLAHAPFPGAPVKPSSSSNRSP